MLPQALRIRNDNEAAFCVLMHKERLFTWRKKHQQATTIISSALKCLEPASAMIFIDN